MSLLKIGKGLQKSNFLICFRPESNVECKFSVISVSSVANKDPGDFQDRIKQEFLNKNKNGARSPADLSFYSAFLTAVGAAVGAEIFNGSGFISTVGALVIYNLKKGPAAEET